MAAHDQRTRERERIALAEVSSTTWRRLQGYLRPVHRPLALAIGLTVVITLSSLAGPYLLGIAIDGPLREGNVEGLVLIFAIFMVLNGVNWIAQYYQTNLTAVIGQRVIYDMREDLFKHVQVLSMRFFESRSIGRILSRLTNDVHAINNMVSNSITTFFSQSLVLFAIAGIMVALHWRLALICFFVIPLAVVIVAVVGRRLRIAYHGVRRRIADVNATLEENISGMREIQAMRRERENMENFRELNQENLEANLHAARLSSAFWPSVDILSIVGTVLVIWFGGWMIAEGTLTIGLLVMFLGYVDRFFHPIRQLSEVINTVQSAMASAERISQYMDENPEVNEVPPAERLTLPTDGRGQVTFNQVNFGYVADEQILFDISFSLEPGQTAALVGPTGAGKTSIISLLGRFYDVWSGEIRLDDVPIHRLPLRELRREMAVVLQDNILFAGTVIDNVRFGRPDATDEEIVAACKLVHAHEFIERLPDGYRTEVREGGRRLSAGQRQLLAFARALIANPRVLVLDEATSDIDVYTEAKIQSALEELLADRTAVIISHRLSTIRRADRILVIDEGRLVEDGSHEDLLRRGGLYSTLYRTQMLTETGYLSDAADQ